MKKRIQLLNNISRVIYNELPGERYEVGKGIEDPNGIMRDLSLLLQGNMRAAVERYRTDK